MLSLLRVKSTLRGHHFINTVLKMQVGCQPRGIGTCYLHVLSWKLEVEAILYHSTKEKNSTFCNILMEGFVIFFLIKTEISFYVLCHHECGAFFLCFEKNAFITIPRLSCPHSCFSTTVLVKDFPLRLTYPLWSWVFTYINFFLVFFLWRLWTWTETFVPGYLEVHKPLTQALGIILMLAVFI